MGSDTLFSFATSFGLDGRVHPTYMVFPRPISPELSRASSSEWDSIADVYAAFVIAA